MSSIFYIIDGNYLLAPPALRVHLLEIRAGGADPLLQYPGEKMFSKPFNLHNAGLRPVIRLWLK